MNDYIIIGDTENYKDCLVCVCGTSFERAQAELDRMLNNPTDNDKRIIRGHTNLRIEEVPEEDCWWNGKLD